MNRSFIKIFLISLTAIAGFFDAIGQEMKAGFSKSEYRELMSISARTSGGPDYYKDIPAPEHFKRSYRSEAIGLDNLWEMWISDKDAAVISLRGTTQNAESWLANLYAAMVSAKGVLHLGPTDSFEYELAKHPQAAVHVGWLLSTAYLSKEIIPQIQALHKKGYRNFYIVGHSQGGAISYLLTSHLKALQQRDSLAKDIKFKTYGSAAPKPGNLYYAHEYEAQTQEGWAFNVVNAADWVPEVPMSIQTVGDFNAVNPFANAGMMIKKQTLLKRLALKHIYNKLSRPTLQAQRNYEKYLGKMTSKMIQQQLKEYTPPKYYNSNHYVRTGRIIVLLPDEHYRKTYPDDKEQVFMHHLHAPYLMMVDALSDEMK